MAAADIIGALTLATRSGCLSRQNKQPEASASGCLIRFQGVPGDFKSRPPLISASKDENLVVLFPCPILADKARGGLANLFKMGVFPSFAVARILTR